MLAGNAKHIKRYVVRPNEIVPNLQMWRAARPTEEKVIFIGGAPRSGTTLVQRMISVHSQSASLPGESDVFSPKSLFDYERFRPYIEYDAFCGVIERASSVVEFFILLHKAALNDDDVFHRKLVIEKTPQHIKRAQFILDHFPNARMIHVVRDPRDCFVSARSSGNIPQGVSPATYASYWRRCVTARLRCNDPRIIDVRYEDLTLDPEACIKRIDEFIGVPFEAAQLRGEALGADPRSADRAFSRLSAKIDNSTVAKWRSELDAADLKAFWRLEKQMARFGYDW